MKKILVIFLINIILFSWVLAISDNQKSKIKIFVNNLEKRINSKWENLRSKYLMALTKLKFKYKDNLKKIEIIEEVIKLLMEKSTLELSSWSNSPGFGTNWPACWGLIWWCIPWSGTIDNLQNTIEDCYIGQVDPSGIVYSCDGKKKIMANSDASEEMKFDFKADIYCKNWNFGGFTWRLPTWDEFSEIYKNLNSVKEVWSTFNSTKYWLLDDYKICPSSAWNTFVDLTSKSAKCGNVFVDIMWVRCVRD
jgi:hypothetical protein